MPDATTGPRLRRFAVVHLLQVPFVLLALVGSWPWALLTAALAGSAICVGGTASTTGPGGGPGFSPTDLAATSLASCIITTMAIQTRNDGLALEGIRAEVEKHMTTTPPRRLARIVVRLNMPAGIPAAARERLQKIAHGCPVALSLHPEVVQEVSFVYPD